MTRYGHVFLAILNFAGLVFITHVGSEKDGRLVRFLNFREPKCENHTRQNVGKEK
jgi:hypothetical protein